MSASCFEWRDSHSTYTAAVAASIAYTQPSAPHGAGRYEASLEYAAE